VFSQRLNPKFNFAVLELGRCSSPNEDRCSPCGQQTNAYDGTYPMVMRITAALSLESLGPVLEFMDKARSTTRNKLKFGKGFQRIFEDLRQTWGIRSIIYDRRY
jgi:hypothetical protein